MPNLTQGHYSARFGLTIFLTSTGASCLDSASGLESGGPLETFGSKTCLTKHAMWVRVLRLETREKMELTPLCGVEGGFTPQSVLKLGVLFAKHHNILLRLSAFILGG